LFLVHVFTEAERGRRKVECKIMLKQYRENFSGVDFTINVLRIVIIVLVVVGSARTLMAGRITGEQWVDLIIGGLAQGSIYALIALGYTLVYGILLMINFAHGEVFMAGAFSTVFLARYFKQTGFLDSYPFLAIPILIIFSGLISMTIAVLLERIAYRPLRNAPRLVPLITAIGATFFLQYTFVGFYGTEFRSYPDVDILKGSIDIAGYGMPVARLFVFASSLVLMAGLYFLVERTKIGKAMRAVSENKEVARLMGVNIDLVIMFTFALGGMLAGAAGVINGLYRPPGVNAFMGFRPGIKAFTSAVLGGIGNVPGAMIGGLFLGVIENIGPNLVLSGLGITGFNQLQDVIAFTMLVLVLIFRPQGILGERLTEKKA
jgi:branched-chain amino acid transport system permease protein